MNELSSADTVRYISKLEKEEGHLQAKLAAAEHGLAAATARAARLAGALEEILRCGSEASLDTWQFARAVLAETGSDNGTGR